MNRKTTMTAVVVVLAIAACGIAVATAQSENPPLDRQKGTITFDTGTHAVGSDQEEFRVANGYELELTLDLEVTGEGDAVFANPPVEFPKGNPPEFYWRPVKDNPRQVVIYELNNNTSGEPDEYFFKARVKFDGEVYKSPDPTIINEPPTG